MRLIGRQRRAGILGQRHYLMAAPFDHVLKQFPDGGVIVNNHDTQAHDSSSIYLRSVTEKRVLSTPGSLKNLRNRPQRYLKVEPKAPGIDIIQVELGTVVKSLDLVPSIH